jgi:hypothetical protein
MLKSTGSGSDSAGGVLESTGCASKGSSAGALVRLPCCRYREEKRETERTDSVLLLRGGKKCNF